MNKREQIRFSSDFLLTVVINTRIKLVREVLIFAGLTFLFGWERQERRLDCWPKAAWKGF
jgi:hypothetical protein